MLIRSTTVIYCLILTTGVVTCVLVYTDLLPVDKLLGKVSLSPQRRSFQRGCSWKEKNLANSNNTISDNSAKPNTPPTASPLETPQSDQHFTFDHQKSHPHTSTQRHGNTSSAVTTAAATNTTSTNTNTTTPRVIHHTPLRDREHSDSRHDSQEGWVSGGHESNWKKMSRNNHVSCVSSGMSDVELEVIVVVL